MREVTNMGRPREFDADKALAGIMDVFWANGFEGASMRDLVDRTGLKKGSLYAAFGDKRAMYHKALALYDSIWIDRAVCGLTGDAPPLARIDAFLQSAIRGKPGETDRRGCFICNASVDQAPLDPDAARMVQASFGRMETALAEAVAEVRPGGAADGVERDARHLMSVYFGLRVLSKAGAETAMLDDAKRVALQGLSP